MADNIKKEIDQFLDVLLSYLAIIRRRIFYLPVCYPKI